MSTSLSGLSLPLRIDPDTGGWATTSDDAKIRENLVHILLTSAGERPMRRAFGGGVQALVHDPDGVVLHSLLRHQITAAIATWEPRVQVRDLRVATDPDEPGSGVVHVHLEYVVRATREPARIRVPLSIGSAP